MPRPDVAAIGTSYRRIPILAIGRDIYNDTRLILRKLEQLYPDATSISTYSPDQRAIQLLLESWTVDSLFARAALLIPVNLPAMNDAAFLKDRREYSGRPWAKDTMEKMRPEALVEVRSAFELLETTLLGDGRDWILKTDGPSLADIEGMGSLLYNYAEWYIC
jgi:glutathione S-transferase